MNQAEIDALGDGQSAISRELSRYCSECHNPLEWLGCDQCDGEGEVDGYEDDPLWYSPGEMEVCSACCGSGGDWYCPYCAAE
jgi:DnaJ-class molecular chaperone